MFDTSMPSEDSFTELKFGMATAMSSSLPVPVTSPTTAAVSAGLTPRKRVSRALSFDDAGVTSTPPAAGTQCSVSRPSLVARRRRCCAKPPSGDDRRPSRTPTVAEPVTVPPPSVISGCIDEEDDARADLIGDMTVKYVLPLENNSKHADLKTISPHTVSQYMLRLSTFLFNR